MSVKMDFKSKHLEKMESLVMKENHLLVTYGGTFVIVLTARKKKVLKKIDPQITPSYMDPSTPFVYPWQAYPEEDCNPTIPLCS